MTNDPNILLEYDYWLLIEKFTVLYQYHTIEFLHHSLVA